MRLDIEREVWTAVSGLVHRERNRSRVHVKRIYYVATRILFVLVEAATEAEARSLGQSALDELYRQRLKRSVTADIRTIRPATDAELSLDHRFRRSQRRRRAVPGFAKLLTQIGGTVRTRYL